MSSCPGISHLSTAYHLDKLVDDGLLEAPLRAADRPARARRRPAGQTVPAPCHYATVAELLPALWRPTGPVLPAPRSTTPTPSAPTLGVETARRLTSEGHRQPVLAVLRQVLARRGYEPHDDAGSTIRLRNCPFDRIAAQHPELVCGANLATVEGLTDQLDGDQAIRPMLDPGPDAAASSSPATPADVHWRIDYLDPLLATVAELNDRAAWSMTVHRPPRALG
jgi:hypothetical protein